MPGMVHNIRIVFGAQTQPSITIQQSDYNSRTIQAACFTSSGTPMDFSDTTVTVVYNAGADPTKEYPVTVNGNVLSFTMPGLAAQTAGSWSMQIFIYWAGSLLHSAEIPYTVLKTITPGTGGDDPVPALVLLIQQAQEAIAGANEAASTANQAAGSANEKAGIAASAANSANKAASNAATMASLAQTATANANSAANSASNAAESANQAAASANAAAASASQVADDVQKKAESGAFNGKNGLDAPQIDDTQITTTNPWSSMQIVKTVCPPFTVSGSVVQCYPVKNYPLSVQASWEPRQEGEGDPSPENVRPITGYDSLSLTRCGKNLLDAPANYNNIYVWGRQDLHQNGQPLFPAGNYSFYTPFNFLELQTLNEKGEQTGIWYSTTTVTITALESFYLVLDSGNVENDGNLATMCTGSTPTAYEPYTGTTAMLTLPETIYGGTVDAVTGEGAKTIHRAVLDGTEEWVLNAQMKDSGINGYQAHLEFLADDSYDCICSHFGGMMWDGVLKEDSVAVTSRVMVVRTNGSETLEDWKSFLAAQYAAGTPVTIAYKLATPTTFQATGGQSLPALPGTNTIYTDADTVTVSGLSDPIATIASLQSRVSALESAQTNM